MPVVPEPARRPTIREQRILNESPSVPVVEARLGLEPEMRSVNPVLRSVVSAGHQLLPEPWRVDDLGAGALVPASIKAGTGGLAGLASGVAKFAGAENTGDMLAEWEATLQRSAGPEPKLSQDPVGWAARQAGSGLVTTLPALAVGGVAGAVSANAAKAQKLGALAASFLMGIGDTQQEIEQAGWTEPSVGRTATVFAAAIPYAVLDAILPAKILGRAGSPKLSWARNRLEDVWMEGGPEAAQSFLTQLAANIGTGRPISAGQVAMEGLGGAVAGPAIGGASSVVSSAMDAWHRQNGPAAPEVQQAIAAWLKAERQGDETAKAEASSRLEALGVGVEPEAAPEIAPEAPSRFEQLSRQPEVEVDAMIAQERARREPIVPEPEAPARQMAGLPNLLNALDKAEPEQAQGLGELETRLLSQHPELERLQLQMSDRGVELHHIEVASEARDSGVGSEVMRDITEWADRNGKTVFLQPASEPGTASSARLTRFYKQFGFKEHSEGNETLPRFAELYRPPQAPSPAPVSTVVDKQDLTTPAEPEAPWQELPRGSPEAFAAWSKGQQAEAPAAQSPALARAESEFARDPSNPGILYAKLPENTQEVEEAIARAVALPGMARGQALFEVQQKYGTSAKTVDEFREQVAFTQRYQELSRAPTPEGGLAPPALEATDSTIPDAPVEPALAAPDPAEAQAPAAPEPRVVTLRKAEVAELRERLGLDAMEPHTRAGWEEALAGAQSQNLSADIIHTVRAVRDSGRTLTPTEHAGAVQRLAELERTRRGSNELLVEAQRTGDTVTSAREASRAAAAIVEIAELTEATKDVNTIAGRALSAIKMGVDVETFTLGEGVRLAYAAKGASLTPDEIGKVETLTNAVQGLEAEVRQRKSTEDVVRKKRTKEVAEAVVRVENRVKRTRAPVEKLVAERALILADLEKLGLRLNDVTGVTAEGLYLIGRLATNHIQTRAVTASEQVSLDEVVKHVLGVLNNPDLGPQDVYAALNASDPKRKAKRVNDAQRQVQALKAEARLMDQIAKAEVGVFDESTPRPQQRKEIRILKAHLTRLRESAYRTARDGKQLAGTLRTIDELQDHLANQTLPKKEPRQARPVSPALEAARGKMADLRRQLQSAEKLADIEEQLRTGNLKAPEPRQARPVSPALEAKQIALARARKQWQQAIADMAPRTVHSVFGEVGSLARSVKATADMSATMRQALWVSARRPGEAAKTFGKSARAFFSEYSADQVDNAIRQHPNQLIRDRAKLFLSEGSGPLSTREEHFKSSLAERIPVLGQVVKASDRSMRTTLNLMRVAAFDGFVESHPNATDAELAAWADWVNVSTGRGDLGRASAIANELGLAFFAPRYAWSRFQTPYAVVKHWQQPRVRKEVAKDMAAVAALGLSALGLAALAGFKVGTDPDDPDFGKIVIGTTHVDLWAGVQQPMRLLLRVANAATDGVGLTGAEGADVDDPLDLLARFGEFKLSPLIATPRELITGKNVLGENIKPSDTAIRALLPLLAADVYDTYQLEGAGRAAMVAPLLGLGVGVQTYGLPEPTRQSGRTIQPRTIQPRTVPR